MREGRAEEERDREKEEKDKGRNSAHAEIFVRLLRGFLTSDFLKQWLVSRVNPRIFVPAHDFGIGINTLDVIILQVLLLMFSALTLDRPLILVYCFDLRCR